MCSSLFFCNQDQWWRIDAEVQLRNRHPTLVSTATGRFRYTASDKLLPFGEDESETSAGGKKASVQNALNVFHVWLHFCWHFSSVLINMETKLNFWLLVDFLPPPPSLLSLLFLLSQTFQGTLQQNLSRINKRLCSTFIILWNGCDCKWCCSWTKKAETTQKGG